MVEVPGSHSSMKVYAIQVRKLVRKLELKEDSILGSYRDLTGGVVGVLAFQHYSRMADSSHSAAVRPSKSEGSTLRLTEVADVTLRWCPATGLTPQMCRGFPADSTFLGLGSS